MSQDPKQIWQKLPVKQKAEILAELIHICREITNESIKINKTNNIQSNYPTTISTNNQT